MEKPKKEEKSSTVKKPFNKKKWREQKYGGKAKVSKWEDIHRRKALRAYNKELQKLNITRTQNGTNEQNKTKSLSRLKQAQLKYNKIKQEKEEKRKEQERIKQEKIEAIKAYKAKKVMKYKKLCKKTAKGQPVMRGRIELLLEKIQNEYVKK